MIIENGTTFENNYARAAAYFLGTCAPEPFSANELAAYKLITGLYRAILDDATGVGFNVVPDTTLVPWEIQKGREKDIKNIREPIAKIELLIKEFFDLVRLAEVCTEGLQLPDGIKKPKKQLTNLLSIAGAGYEAGMIILSNDCSMGLKKLCDISLDNTIHITDGAKDDKNYLFFSRCVFDPKKNWTALAFDRYLKANGSLIWLCNELEKRGYKHINCRDGKKIGLDYIKQHGKKDEPLKWAWGERTHTGIEVTFEEIQGQPCYLWMRVPMYKTVLENIDKLPESVTTFLVSNTKNCNGCRYCVQTDKTHQRPLAAIKIGQRNKCPLYPGFTLNWRELNTELAHNIVDALDALDNLKEIQ